jgi:hypothetical protein
MAILFVQKAGEVFSLFCVTGDTLEWDVDFIQMVPTQGMLETLEMKDLETLIIRAGNAVRKTLGKNPNKGFVAQQLIANWGNVRLNQGLLDGTEPVNDMKVKDKSDPHYKYTKVKLFGIAEDLGLKYHLDGKTKITTSSTNGALVEAILAEKANIVKKEAKQKAPNK